MVTERKKFLNQETPSIVDTEYRDCHFAHDNPITVDGKKRGVRIFPGDDTARTFIDCNMMNVEPPPGSTVTGGLSVIKENSVLVSSESATHDDESGTMFHYKDVIHGRYIDGAYIDNDPIVDVLFDEFEVD